MQEQDLPDIELVYDGQCPICRFHANNVSIAAENGRLVRVDARKPGPLIDEITARGLDIDDGIVLRIGNELYYDADAVHQLTRLSEPGGLMQRTLRAVFRSPQRARRYYPLVKSLRRLLLKVLGRRPINNLGMSGNDRY